MKVMQLVVGLTVGVLLMIGLIVPVVNSNANETLTVTNTGAYFTVPDDGEHTIVIQHGEITYDGKQCIWPDVSLFNSATLMVGNNWFLRCDSGTSPTQPLRYLFAGPPQEFGVIGTVDPSTDDALTVVINGTNVSATIGEVTLEREGLRYTIADTGDYVLSNHPYLLEDTPIIGGIRTQANVGSHNADIFLIVEGSIGDVENMTSQICRLYVFDVGVIDTATTSFVANTETVDGDLLKLTNIMEAMTFGTDNEYSANITITYVIVPETITYENPHYVGDGHAALIKVIPVMVGIALIAFAAFAVRGRMDD